MTADWIWFGFIFAFGCCIGSFLNVVIYRLPRDKSLVTPPSACPSCGEYIRFYDNIPLVSWLLLGCKCRNCKTPISPRYFVVELLTGSVFLALFVLYFYTEFGSEMIPLRHGGWFIYLLHIILLGAFIAASGIDLELWIIPLNICWFVTAAGLIGSGIGPYVIEPVLIRDFSLLPVASPNTAAMALGGLVGLIVSLILLMSGLIKGSYISQTDNQTENQGIEEQGGSDQTQNEIPEEQFNHRLEACREILFLLPIIICSIAAVMLFKKVESVHIWWLNFTKYPFVAGFFGSLWGYFIGCGVVWAVRILGTLGFGKEAMGLGDVHLMGAAGTIIGPLYVVVAFFIAPFFGLAWAGFQLFFKKIHQIPYGPFLSMGVFVVMILHDWILDRIGLIFYQ